MAYRGFRASLMVAASASLLFACLTVEGPGNTSSGTDGAGSLDQGVDSGFDSGFDSGLDGGFAGCGQYLDACLSDPYCACYIECVQETLELQPDAQQACLTKCNLAEEPFWFEEFFMCIQGEIPDFDTGQDTGASEAG